MEGIDMGMNKNDNEMGINQGFRRLQPGGDTWCSAEFTSVIFCYNEYESISKSSLKKILKLIDEMEFKQ